MEGKKLLISGAGEPFGPFNERNVSMLQRGRTSPEVRATKQSFKASVVLVF